jgi:flagellum-specific peptidoglycan hydrolase FlgJ
MAKRVERHAIIKAWEAAAKKKSQAQTSISASIEISQAVLESVWGQHT